MANPHLKAGDILYSSWGYDQTNIDFYQVVRTTKTMAYIRAIASKILPHDSNDEHRYTNAVAPDVENTVFKGEYCGRLRDAKGNYVEIVRRKIGTTTTWDRHTDANVTIGYISVNDYEYARLWDGSPKHETAAEYGH